MTDNSDNTSLKNINQLRKMLKAYSTLINSASVAVILIDRDVRTIVEANHQAARLLRRPVKEMIGKHCAEFFPVEEKEKYTELLENLPNNENYISIIASIQNSKDSLIPVEISASLLKINSKDFIQNTFRRITRIQVQDVTTRKQTEETLQDSNEGK